MITGSIRSAATLRRHRNLFTTKRFIRGGGGSRILKTGRRPRTPSLSLHLFDHSLLASLEYLKRLPLLLEKHQPTPAHPFSSTRYLIWPLMRELRGPRSFFLSQHNGHWHSSWRHLSVVGVGKRFGSFFLPSYVMQQRYPPSSIESDRCRSTQQQPFPFGHFQLGKTKKYILTWSRAVDVVHRFQHEGEGPLKSSNQRKKKKQTLAIVRVSLKLYCYDYWHRADGRRKKKNIQLCQEGGPERNHGWIMKTVGV